MTRRDIGGGVDANVDADVEGGIRRAVDVASDAAFDFASDASFDASFDFPSDAPSDFSPGFSFVLAPVWPTSKGVKSLVTTRRGGVSLATYDDGGSHAGGEPVGDKGFAGAHARSGDGGLNLGFHTGDSAEAVAANRARLTDYVGQRPIAWVEQCHGVDVAVAGEVIRRSARGQPSVADAVISDQVDEVCAIMVADCLPVLFADTQSRVVGAAHAGWRGLCGGVLERTAQALRAVLSAEDDVVLLAYLGPCIGPSAFEVGAEVRAAFMQAALPGELEATSAAFVAVPLSVDASVDASANASANVSAHASAQVSTANPVATAPENAVGLPQKYLGDLPALARLRLARVGVTGIYGGDTCTVSDRHRFYSYRRDGRTGRFAALIWRQGKP